MSDNPSSSDRVLGKADALIRRHRSFIANAAGEGGQESEPLADRQTAAPSELEEDIPVLTDVIDDPDAAQKTAAEVLSLALTDQQIAIHAAIERWVDETLPEAILHVLDGFTDRLIAAVSERARADLLHSLTHDLPSTKIGNSPD